MAMGGTEYEIILSDSTGVPLADLSGKTRLGGVLWFDAPKAANRIANFALGLPPSFDDRVLEADQIVQFWRKPRGRGGVKRLWQAYFLRKWEMGFEGEDEHLILSGPDPKDLLRRRNVVAHANSIYAKKSGPTDDMLKDIVRDSQSDVIPPTPASGTRAFPNFTVAPDVGLGPTLDKKFAWQKILHTSGSGVLPSIARASREAGTNLFFDVVPTLTGDTITFEFITNVGQPGRDVTEDVIFERRRGNLRNPRLVIDYTEEVNYSYVAGVGQEDARRVTQVSDSVRYESSPYNRCEEVLQDNNLDSLALRRDAGRERLERGRPHVTFSGVPLDTDGTRFGTDWDYGSRVTARYRSYDFPVVILAVPLRHDGKHETVNARLDFDGVWPL